MNKLKVAIIFGGMSTEHDVSIISGINVILNMNEDKYEKYCIYIDKDGIWYEYDYKNDNNVYKVGDDIKNITKIDNYLEKLKNVDVVFPVLHGKHGEDGSIQGICEFIKKPYVGCGILASSVGMDKVYSKVVFEKAGINQTKSVYIKSFNDNFIYVDEKFNEQICNMEEVIKIAENKLKYPVFVKPSNSGSSVGIKKAINKNELSEAIKNAAKYDVKILIEEGIVGKEVECAVLGNEEVLASTVGQIVPAEEFYSFDAKYNNQESYTKIPADISDDLQEEIKKLAVKAFKAIDGKGLSRVDFFVEDNTNKIYLNEINTLPGFTSISMYPSLMKSVGIEYDELIDKVINLALN